MSRRTAILSITVASAILLASAVVSGKPDKGVPFSHKQHIEVVGAACADCHADAGSATVSSIDLLPKMAVCYGCHEKGSADWANLDETAMPFMSAERELIFDHARHIETVGLDCAACHKGVEKASKAPSHALPAMSICIDCHRERELAVNCGTCHSQVQLLRPSDHRADWVLDHVEIARRDAQTCENCHTQTYCQECHNGAALGLAIQDKKDAPQDLIGPMAASEAGRDILILQRAHDLNFLFTHGVEVRSKRSDCAVCHDAQSFCVACHTPADDHQRFMPVWHEVPGFTASGHAELARRDIEVCAGCHDENAAEPTCLDCHRTRVRPHPDDFMKGVKGPWHDEDDAVCFVCHSPGSRTPGQGFCALCHGAVGD